MPMRGAWDALHDVDNRLKTIFDALRMAKGPNELGGGTTQGMQRPTSDEDPFFVVMNDEASGKLRGGINRFGILGFLRVARRVRGRFVGAGNHPHRDRSCGHKSRV